MASPNCSAALNPRIRDEERPESSESVMAWQAARCHGPRHRTGGSCPDFVLAFLVMCLIAFLDLPEFEPVMHELVVCLEPVFNSMRWFSWSAETWIVLFRSFLWSFLLGAW